MNSGKVFVNGRIYTLDAAGTVAEAIAVDGERVLAVGSTSDVRAVAPGAQEIDLDGKTVIPGCNDTHTHLIMHGTACTRSADLTDSRSIAELQSRLRAHRGKNPSAKWIIGERFDQELFSDGRWVTKADLDEVSIDTPVVVVRLCYHALVANTAALRAAKDQLDREQWETGRLAEDDMDLVWRQVPECTDAELERAALHGLNEAHSVGLTSVTCQLDTEAELVLMRRLRDEGRLPVRVRFQWPYALMSKITDEGLATGSGDDYFRCGSIKIFMDGSMGARTCAMIEDFADDPGNCGQLLTTDKQLAEMLVKIQRNGCQAAIHAIGDLAIEQAIDGIEAAMADGNQGNKMRHRLEHVALTNPGLLRRMADLNIVASIQPQFVVTDFWTCDRVGPERYRHVYPFRSMLDAGIRFGMGSDCPVERLAPMQLVHRAVNRDGKSQHECLTVDQTLRAYTLGSAHISFAEADKGSLEVGKLADFVVLSDDPYAVAPQDLEHITPLHTVVGGNMA